MVKPLRSIENHPVISTITVMAALFGVVATVYLRLEAKYEQGQQTLLDDYKAKADDYKDRVDDYKERLAKQEDYTGKYAQEVGRNTALEVKYADANAQVDVLTAKLKRSEDEHWDGKYQTEHVARQSAEQELALATSRYKSDLASLTGERGQLRSQIDELQIALNHRTTTSSPEIRESFATFDKLLADKLKLQEQADALDRQLRDLKRSGDLEQKMLKDKVAILQTENERLRQLVKADPAPILAKSKHAMQVAALIVAVKGLDTVDSRMAIINSLQAITGDLTGEEFASILQAATTLDTVDRRLTIQAASPRLQRPIDPKAMTTILSGMDTVDRRMSVQFLNVRK